MVILFSYNVELRETGRFWTMASNNRHNVLLYYLSGPRCQCIRDRVTDGALLAETMQSTIDIYKY